MAVVHFTPNLARHIDASSLTAGGSTVRDVFDAAFASRARARGYVLDDQGALRKHVQVFLGGEQIRDRVGLTDPVPPGAELWVMQALSGG
jgi:molybdopterin synthase sulfur carrier subunit